MIFASGGEGGSQIDCYSIKLLTIFLCKKNFTLNYTLKNKLWRKVTMLPCLALYPSRFRRVGCPG